MVETSEKTVVAATSKREKNEMVVMVLAIVADDIEPRRTLVGWLFHASSNNIFLAFS